MSLLLDEIALATARLAEAGVDSPRTDAELIAAHVHNVKRGELHTVPDTEFDARFWVDIGRRENREPLQHITGRAYFRYLELDVGPGVFVPRPETEVMTGWVIDRLREMDVAEPVAVDLGTGSGAIALSIAQEVPRATRARRRGRPAGRELGGAEHHPVRGLLHRGRVLLHAGDFVRRRPGGRPAASWPVSPTRSTWWSPTRRTSRSARWCRPRWGSTIRPPRCGAAPTASTRSARLSGLRGWLLRPGGLVAVEHGGAAGRRGVLGVLRRGWLAGYPQPQGPGPARPVRHVDVAWPVEQTIPWQDGTDERSIRLRRHAAAGSRDSGRRGRRARRRACRAAHRHGVRDRRGRVQRRRR